MARLGVIFRAIWSKILGRAEDKHYREILDLSFEDMQKMVIQVGRDLASVAESKHRIIKLVQNNRADAERYESAAVKFLEAGDEEHARQALEQKSYVDQQLTALQADLSEVDAQQQELEATKKQLDRKVEEFRSQKELLKARHTAASASARIGETVTGISEEAMNVGQTVGRMRERTESLEARAAGIKELMSSGALEDMFTPGQTALDRSAAEIERKSSVDEDLARLKKQLTPA